MDLKEGATQPRHDMAGCRSRREKRKEGKRRLLKVSRITKSMA